MENTPSDKSTEEDDSRPRLHLAVESRDVDLTQILLDEGADPNSLGIDGFAPLHLAAMQGDAQLIRLLLEHEADPNIRRAITPFATIREATPLHIAAEMGNALVATELIKEGCDVNISDTQRFWTPLLIAVREGHNNIVDLLLGNGANVDGDYRAASSPLHEAIVKHRTDLVEQLCLCGANLDRVDKDRNPLVDLAAFQGDINIVKLLLLVSNDTIDPMGKSRKPSW